jgi:hypothetical protein
MSCLTSSMSPAVGVPSVITSLPATNDQFWCLTLS